MIVSCRYSIVQHSPTKLAGGAAVPVSLASGGAGCLVVLQDLPRVAEAGLYTLETVWRLAEDATVGPEGDYGCRGAGGWARLPEEGQDQGHPADDLGWDVEPHQRPDLQVYDPIMGEMRAKGLMERAKMSVTAVRETSEITNAGRIILLPEG